jgi:hypothetical protein
MGNIVGCTVYFFKQIDVPIITDFNSEMMGQKLEIAQKIIPLNLKDSFSEFIKSIGRRVPLEDEFNQWYSKNTFLQV